MTITSLGRVPANQQPIINKSRNAGSEFSDKVWKVYQTHALSVKDDGLIERGAELTGEESGELGPVYNLTEERIRIMMEQSNKAFTYTQNKGFNKADKWS